MREYTVVTECKIITILKGKACDILDRQGLDRFDKEQTRIIKEKLATDDVNCKSVLFVTREK